MLDVPLQRGVCAFRLGFGLLQLVHARGDLLLLRAEPRLPSLELPLPLTELHFVTLERGKTLRQLLGPPLQRLGLRVALLDGDCQQPLSLRQLIAQSSEPLLPTRKFPFAVALCLAYRGYLSLPRC